MVEYEAEKEAIDDVIDTYGTDTILATQASETYNEDTGTSETYNTGVTIKGVVYNYFTGRIEWSQYGNVELGDLNLVVKGDNTIKEKDRITYNSVNYLVKEVNSLPLGDTVLAILLVLIEEFD